MWKCQIRGFREPFSIFFNFLDASAQVSNFSTISCLKWVELYLNDQKLSKSSFDDLIWLQNYQIHFRFGPFHWYRSGHATMYWWLWSQGTACKWCYDFFLVILTQNYHQMLRNSKFDSFWAKERGVLLMRRLILILRSYHLKCRNFYLM